MPYFKFAPNEQAPNTAQRPQTSESLTAHFRLGKQALVLKFGSPCSGSGFQGNQWLQEPCKTPVLCSCSEQAVLEPPLTPALPGGALAAFPEHLDAIPGVQDVRKCQTHLTDCILRPNHFLQLLRGERCYCHGSGSSVATNTFVFSCSLCPSKQ